MFLSAGCPGPDWPKCENDEHCEKQGDKQVDFVCVFGQCQECGRDGDCAAGKQCKKNRCQALCKSNAQCGKGQTCDVASGDCKKAKKVAEKPKKVAGGEGSACVETGDCKKGFVCSDDKCVDEATAQSSENNGDGDAAGDCASEARVQFEFNLYDLTPESQSTLDEVARCMQANAAWKLTIEGHADERGTTEYNLGLGEKRARAVKDYLGRLGVGKARVRTVSYGEERPVDNSSGESAWATNRRGELLVKMQ